MANFVQKLFLKINNKIRRVNSVRHAYDYPSENGGWRKFSRPVLGEKKEGIYFDPYVREWSNKFVMYVSFRNGGSIVRCDSEDGIFWTHPVEVLKGTGMGDWENVVNRASVIKKDDIWYMWYTGQDTRNSKIGLAISEDGIHFNRYKDNPVLVPEMQYEQQSVMNPCVLWDDDENIFKMWYSAGQKYEPDVICYATSENGINWNKCKENPVLSKGTDEYDCVKVGGCDVLRAENGYQMFYIGYQNVDNARICLAESVDGIEWTRNKENPVLSASKDSWDAHAVYKPTVYYRKREQKWYLWYNGRKENDEYIGLARKEKNVIQNSLCAYK
jgi:predicted GH43/DUF377 family glycosyl hydrolase